MQADHSESPRLHLESLLPSEWERLVRLCGSLSGSVDDAEDLAQETVIEAWRHVEMLSDRNALHHWLSGIARNVCRRWARRQGRDVAGQERFARLCHREIVHDGYRLADRPEHEIELEQEEMAVLLDRALELLPESTRDVLVQRYVDERAHAEIAEQLGVSEGAVAVRIHRGKMALRRVLTRPELSDDAMAYGLIEPEAAGWHETRIWCPFCAKCRLLAHIDRETGELSYRCAGQCFHNGSIIGSKHMKPCTSQLTSFKSILTRELIDLHDWYRQALDERMGWCYGCGHPVAIERWTPHGSSSLAECHIYGIQMTCRSCGSENSASLWHLVLDTPVAQQFWRRHPRMRALPVREVEVDGRAVLLSGFASADDGSKMEVLSARETYEILHVDDAAGQ